jgi:hypothetical protein
MNTTFSELVIFVLLLPIVWWCFSLFFRETQKAEDHVKKRDQGIRRFQSEFEGSEEEEVIYDESIWNTEHDQFLAPLSSRTNQGHYNQTDMRLIPKEDMGLIPKVDMGLIPKADMGLIPKADMGLIPKVDMGLIPGGDINTDHKTRVNSVHGSRVNKNTNNWENRNVTYGTGSSQSMTPSTQRNSGMMINPYSEY